MKTGQELYNEHFNRLKIALDMGIPDRTPVVLFADSFCAKHMGFSMKEFCSDIELSNKIILDSMKQLGDVDGIEVPMSITDLMQFGNLAKIKVPGIELPDDQVWQVDEKERLTVEDYDTIINLGGLAKFKEPYREKHGIHINFERIGHCLEFMPQAVRNAMDAGYVMLEGAGVIVNHPTEPLSVGRSMPKLIHDLFRMPDKVEAVMDVIVEESIAVVKSQIQKFKPLTVFITMSRCSSVFLSRKLWDRFVFPYLKKIAEAIVEAGSIPYFHIDGDYERDLKYFLEMPKGSLFSSDGFTNIYLIKEVLGDHMSIRGDVPPAMLTVGTPDDVYNYCSKLIREIGPKGFILSSGCTIPSNAKVENVKAMVAAATGK